jgi:hypothetical protein
MEWLFDGCELYPGINAGSLIRIKCDFIFETSAKRPMSRPALSDLIEG